MPGYIVDKIDEDLPTEVEVIRTETPPELDKLQEHVGGYSEPVFTVPSPFRNQEVTGYVNEEGLLIGLPIKFAVSDSYGQRPFAGSLVIVGLTRMGEGDVLTDEEIDHYLARIQTGLVGMWTSPEGDSLMTEGVVFAEGI